MPVTPQPKSGSACMGGSPGPAQSASYRQFVGPSGPSPMTSLVVEKDDVEARVLEADATGSVGFSEQLNDLWAGG